MAVMEYLTRDKAGPACIDCDHPLGWHMFRTGSCLECVCLGPGKPSIDEVIAEIKSNERV